MQITTQSLERIRAGRDSVEIYENAETLSAVRERFLSVITDLSETDRIRVVDGYRSVDDVAAEIAQIVSELLKDSNICL